MRTGWSARRAFGRLRIRRAIEPLRAVSWRAVVDRLRSAGIEIGRLTVAAVVSYLVADAVSPGILDLTAPLTALLVVQASTVGTLQMGLVRVGAVLTGVLVAVAVTSVVGLSWWSLAAVIALSLALARTLRLREQSLETPISAMLILAVSAPGVAAEVRVVNTLIGTVVGIAFTLLLPVAIPNARASEAVRRVARSQAALLNEVAIALGDRAPLREEVDAWLDWSRHIGAEVEDAATAVADAAETRRLNARALVATKVHPGLRSALDRLERCLAAERALLVVISRETEADAASGPRSDLQRAFAVVLDDLANALRAFADLIGAEYGRGSDERVEEALGRMVEVVRETRAVLTELVLLDVDPQAHRDVWLLQGSVLTAVDQILRQLDLEQGERSERPWLARVRRGGVE